MRIFPKHHSMDRNMYQLSFSEENFLKFKEFLNENEIELYSYKAYEYFVRLILTQYNSNFRFPEEKFIDEPTCKNLIKHWNEFSQHNQGAEWGFHPFYSDEKLNSPLDEILKMLTQLESELPNISGHSIINGVRADVKDSIEKAKKSIFKVQRINLQNNFILLEQDLYLFISKYLAEKLFSEYKFNKYNELIKFKKDCYFDFTEEKSKNALRKKIEKISDQDRIIQLINQTIEKYNINKVISNFQSNPQRYYGL